MNRKVFTAIVMLAMVLVGGLYWMDLSLFTSPVSGFVEQGPLWLRYLVLAAVLALVVVGLRGVSPYAIGILRLKNRGMGGLFIAAGIAGAVYGIACTFFAVTAMLGEVATGPTLPLVVSKVYQLLLGFLYIWYGIWMLLAARQLFSQKKPSPTKSALPGVLTAMPFCLQTVYRVLLKPSSIYRVANIVHIFTALFAMLWFGMLLRALYIALVRQRVRWMYLIGLITFLFATCLECTQTLHGLVFGGFALLPLLEAVSIGLLGLVAGFVSMYIAGQDSTSAEEEAAKEAAKISKKVYRSAPF